MATVLDVCTKMNKIQNNRDENVQTVFKIGNNKLFEIRVEVIQ